MDEIVVSAMNVDTELCSDCDSRESETVVDGYPVCRRCEGYRARGQRFSWGGSGSSEPVKRLTFMRGAYDEKDPHPLPGQGSMRRAGA